MIDKLRSHLEKRKAQKGFTLIELLVVIAIIAILVVIVVVAINPVQRLNDAADRTASSNVRSTGTLIGTCVTQELASGGTVADCDTNGEVATGGQGNVPTGVDIEVDASDPNDVCATADASGSGATNHWFRYRHSTGQVEPVIVGAYPAAGARCP